MTARRASGPVRAALSIGVTAVAVVVVLLATRGAPAASGVSTASGSWSLPRLGGAGQVSLAQFRGRPVVVDFFASWGTACQAELPDFLSVSRSLSGRVQFAGVDSEENGDGLAMARRSGVTAWPLALDVGGSQRSGLRDAVESVPGMPVTAFYDAQGHLLRVRLGALTADALTAQISQLYGIG